MNLKSMLIAVLAGVLGLSGSAVGQQTRPAEEAQRRLESRLREAQRRVREMERQARDKSDAAREQFEQRMRDALAQAEDRMRDAQERWRGQAEDGPGEPARRDIGWLGLELSPVPAAVAAQLDIKPDTGLMIRNIFTDSPADKAGLQRYDVIVTADGQPVRNNVPDFADLVRGKKPGDAITLTFYRGGKRTDVSLKAAELPDRLFDRKYSEDPDVLLQRDYGLRGRIFRPGPHGGWMMEDLGKMPELRRFFIAPGRPAATQPEGDQARRVDKEGRSLQVTRRPDGSIEVRREMAGRGPGAPGVAMTQTRVFRNADELRAADPEAAELLDSMGEPSIPRAPGLPRPPAPPAPEAEAPSPLPPPPGVVPPAPPAETPGTQPAPSGGRPQLNPPERRFFVRPPLRAPLPPPAFKGPASRPEGMPRIEAMPRPGDPRWQEFMNRFMQGPMKDVLTQAPAVRFDVQPDGSIAVHKRTPDAELNMTFRNRQEFQQQAPELYKQFEQLQREMLR